MASVSSSSGNSNVDNGRTPIQYEVHRTFCTKELVRTIASGVFVTLGLITAITGGSVFFSLNASLTVATGVVFLIIGIAMTVLGIYLVYSKRATAKASEVVDHISMESKEAEKSKENGEVPEAEKLHKQGEMRRLELQFLRSTERYKMSLDPNNIRSMENEEQRYKVIQEARDEAKQQLHDDKMALLKFEEASAAFHIYIDPKVRNVMEFRLDITLDKINTLIKDRVSQLPHAI